MRRAAALLFVSSTLVPGSGGLAAQAPSAATRSADARPLTGTWKSDGYGYVLAAHGDTLQVYEATRTTCLPVYKMLRITKGAAGAELTYEADDSPIIMRLGESANERRMHSDGAASDVVIRQIPSLPTVCATPTPNTPVGNFDVFAQNWAEHYILFREKHADWPAIVASARARVKPTTTPDELFTILSGMIAPFEDAHTNIRATAIKRQFRALRKGSERAVRHGIENFVQKDVPAILAVTDRKLRGPIRKFCNDQVQYGRLDDSTGYLRILSEGGYAKEGGFAGGLVALEAAFDTIFGDSKLKGLVFDVRINFGGADPYGLALASRLASTQWVAYAKEARNDPVDLNKWTSPQPSMVRPSKRARFLGPVVELTGPITISAGETTTQALMGRTPKVLRIGENTQGVFSDVLSRHMPNGWTFGLPNEVFRASDGKTFDGPGIPPDIEVPVFLPADLDAGRDPALARALVELYRKR